MYLTVNAQQSVADLFRVDYETPLTIELKRKEELENPIEPVKKKKRKNPKIYYGIKGKKGFTRNGFGKNVVVELFYYLKKKDFVAPDEYTRDFYVYDFKKRKIVNTRKIKDPTKVGVLHGHYLKKMGDQVLEEGYFYQGKKHMRWVRLNRHDILQEKEIYWKGFTQESLLGFYDFNRTQLREVIPVHFGERQGTYLAFHSDGKIAATGEYKYDKKIGIWREYYQNSRPKREIKYPDDPFDDQIRPVITREWDQAGNLIYDRKRDFSGTG
jgi:antitoxin component YwqK of YwqJK toxin-antitoxin module